MVSRVYFEIKCHFVWSPPIFPLSRTGQTTIISLSPLVPHGADPHCIIVSLLYMGVLPALYVGLHSLSNWDLFLTTRLLPRMISIPTQVINGDSAIGLFLIARVTLTIWIPQANNHIVSYTNYNNINYLVQIGV